MATAEDSADNELWDACVGKSWADLVDDDSKERPSCRKSWADLVDEESQSPRKNYRLRSNSFKIPALKGDPFDEGANFGNADGRSTIPKVDPLPNFGRNLSRNGPKTPVKEQPDIPQEDISLTGHLDVKLGLVSPAKSTRRTVTLKPTAPRSSPSKASKRKPDTNGRDPMTMPSPSKIRRTPKKDASDGDGLRTVTMTPPSRPLLSRKRVRDMLTPTPSKDGKQRVKRDAETDPDILARRQRQIDYGKNTLGYERYTQMVPREKREKNHPKTPPIGIKFSRRAWDGMIKVWRQRLHFWDPPSEGGGNPQCLEIQSDMSDCYSDSSLPNTPVQEMKRKKNERTYRYSRNRSGYSDDLDSGCTPLLD